MDIEVLKSKSFDMKKKNDYHFFLRYYKEYDYKDAYNNKLQFAYNFDSEALKEFKEIFKLKDIVSDKTEVVNFIALMDWVYQCTHFLGEPISLRHLTPAQIIRDAAENKVNLNCATIAIVLNAVYLAMGYHARMIWCLSMDISNVENHVVNIVYSHTQKEWLFFDAANGIYCVDQYNKILSLADFRNHIIDNDEIHFITCKSNHLNKFQQLFYYRYKIYMSKNLFRFCCYDTSDYQTELLLKNKRMIHLNPKLYYPINETRKEHLYYTKEKEYIDNVYLCNAQKFWQSPV